MKTLATFCLSTILISCSFCSHDFATVGQSKEAMKSVHFDEHIAVNQHAYDELVNFLEKNADTIISYRDTKNVVTIVDGGNQTHDTLEKSDCYNFFQNNSDYDITNVPDYLKAKLDTIYHNIGEDNIRQFKVCKDRKIWVEVGTEEGENGLYISHSLWWNTKPEKDYTYSDIKDTLLSENCFYRLEMREVGH